MQGWIWQNPDSIQLQKHLETLKNMENQETQNPPSSFNQSSRNIRNPWLIHQRPCFTHALKNLTLDGSAPSIIAPRRPSRRSRRSGGFRPGDQVVKPVFTTSGWWYTYPIEKYESQLG